ncbi:putative MFS family arabinose efflux permease [Tumebacillus sp. BK434]|uniref:MFS transporter n=1 Tax=Tumebacillus sp. BK434 TaxID=2512169 RepID=UPI001047BF58|nr:MFS transporter [Tumebacillus sp. BK434]TCP59203.1 putative MFS family arabinose efflux permease [Tumebacillus sp. BK434]
MGKQTNLGAGEQLSAAATTGESSAAGNSSSKPASVWGNRDFFWLFVGRTIAQAGTAVTSIAIPWLILELTGSATQTGLAFAVGFIPYLLLSLPAGVWADTWNRKTLMVAADSGRLLLLLLIPLVLWLFGDIPILLLFAVQAGISLLSALFDAAYSACLPNVVQAEHLQQANAALQMGASFSRIGGRVGGGLLIVVFDAANTLLVDVSTYAISILTIYFIRASFSKERQGKAPASLFDGMREGLRYVWERKTLRMLALFSMLVNLVGPGMDLALIYRANQELHLSAHWAGYIMAGLSGGMLAGSFFLARIKNRFSTRSLLTVSTLLQVIPPFLFAITHAPVVLVLGQVMIGCLIIVWSVTTTTLRQSTVPDELQGRCASVFRIIAWVTIPLGSTVAGVVNEAWGSAVFFLIAGSVLCLVCFSFLQTRSKLVLN